MRKIILSLILVIIVLIFGYYHFAGKKYDEIRTNILKIELGMSKEEVRDIMGEPIRIMQSVHDSIPIEIWSFEAPLTASAPPQVTFNKTKGIVVKIIGSETHRLVDEDFYGKRRSD
jgi:hypothetical protein